MNTMTPTQIRISSMIMLIAWIMLALAGQRWLWPALQNLPSAVSPVTITHRPAQVEAGPPALLLLNTDALVLTTNSGAAQVMARVRDSEGKPVAGVEVHFQSERGSLSPATVHTGANGAATAAFSAGGTPGQALITATAGDFSQSAAIQIVKPNTDASANVLALEVGNRRIPLGQETSLTVRLRDAAGQPLAGELVTFFGALGEVTPASAVTDGAGRATARFHAGNSAGQAMITALAGSASQSFDIQVGDPVVTPPPDGEQHSIYLPLVTR